MTNEHPPQNRDHDPDGILEEQRENERPGGDAEAAGSTAEREAIAADEDDLFGDDEG